MADVIVTPANVALVSGSTRQATAAVTITQGQTVRVGNSGVELAGAGAANIADADGIAITAAAAGNQCIFAVNGATVEIGGAVVQGRVYVVSATAGNIMPESDLGTGNYTTTLAVAVSASQLQIAINPSGVAVA